MRVSNTLKKLHEIAEGVEHKAYLCPAGVLTIGIGHTSQEPIPFEKGDEWTDEQIDEAWRYDVAAAEDDANRLLQRSVTQGVFDATVDLIFNCGTGCRTYLQHVNNDNMEQAEDALLKWINVGGKVSLGLVKRRFADLALFRGEDDWEKYLTCNASTKNYSAFNALIKDVGYKLEPDSSKVFKLVKTS